jgi:hypothetical protein
VKVYIILEPNFGANLTQLDLAAPIWIVQSTGNNPTVDRLWRAKAGDVTSFRPQGFAELIGTVDEHHPGWTELEVHGLCAADAEEALAEYGPGTFAPRGYSFRFQRQRPK